MKPNKIRRAHLGGIASLAVVAFAMNSVAHGQPKLNGEQVDHKACLEARDYEGCMRFRTDKTRETSKEICDSIESGWCIAKEGIDMLGVNKLQGLLYKTFPSELRVVYKSQQPSKLTVRETTARYIAFDLVIRKLISGGSQTFQGVTSESTTCSASNGTVSCLTISPQLSSRLSTEGSIQTFAYKIVIDCADKTYAAYKNDRIFAGWKTIDPRMWSQEQKWCDKPEQLRSSEYKI